MQHPLDVLLEYFPSGTTEGERHILPEVFVFWNEYTELMTPAPTNPRIIVGKKGTGKTAVIDFYSGVLMAAGIPSLVVRPMDITLESFSDRTALGEATRITYQALVRAVASRLGSLQSGLLDSAAKVLHDEAVADGKKGRDLVECTVELLPKLAKALGKFDASTLLPHGDRASVAAVQSALQSNVAKSGRAFYIFLDDTDQVAAPDVPGHLNRIWALLLAARELAQRIPQLRAIVTVREEVWRRLLRDSAGQRDQADHFLPLVRHLFPTRSHIAAVLERRFSVAAQAVNGRSNDPYEAFFDGPGAMIPSSRAFSSWRDLIVVRSRERPRDAIQLVNALARAARARGLGKITSREFDHQMREFSAQRVQLLAVEAELECPQITHIVRALATFEYDFESFKTTFQPLRQFLRSLPTHLGVELYGRALHADDDDDALALLAYLFELGVLNARVADTRQKDGYRHIAPSEEPRLVSRGQWNELQGIVWEVHPAYRDYLIQVQEEVNSKTGLPPRRLRRVHTR